MNEKSGAILRVCNQRPTNFRSERSEFEYGLGAPRADLMRRVVVPTALRGNGWLAVFPARRQRRQLTIHHALGRGATLSGIPPGLACLLRLSSELRGRASG